MKLYLVKDGIENACVIDKNRNRVFNTNYYSITYNFIKNEGCIEKKSEYNWRLYTQIGERIGKSRYYNFTNFEDCIKKLKILKGDNDILVINQKEICYIKLHTKGI